MSLRCGNCPHSSPFNSRLELHDAYLPWRAFSCVHHSQGSVYTSRKCHKRRALLPGCHIWPFERIETYVIKDSWYGSNVWGIFACYAPVPYMQSRRSQPPVPLALASQPGSKKRMAFGSYFDQAQASVFRPSLQGWKMESQDRTFQNVPGYRRCQLSHMRCGDWEHLCYMPYIGE